MNVQELVAYCGLTCKSCPIYWATRELDKQRQKIMRAKIAKLCKDYYGLDFYPEGIPDCDGCRTESETLFSGCVNCEIRKCARQREFETCANCPEYICKKLQNFLIPIQVAKSG